MQDAGGTRSGSAARAGGAAEPAVLVSSLPAQVQRLMNNMQKRKDKQEETAKQLFHEQLDELRQAVRRVLVGNERLGTVSSSSGFENKTLQRACKRNTVDTVDCLADFIQAKVERTQLVPSPVKVVLKEIIAKKDRAGKTLFNLPQVKTDARTIVAGYDPDNVPNSFSASHNPMPRWQPSRSSA